MKNKDSTLPAGKKNQIESVEAKTTTQTPPEWMSHSLQKTNQHLDTQVTFDEESHYMAFTLHSLAGSLNIATAGWHLKQCHAIGGRQFLVNKAVQSNKSVRSLYNYIDVYELIEKAASLGGDQLVQIFAQIDHSKLLLLKPFNTDELLTLTSGEQVRGVTLDDMNVFPKRELERRMKDDGTSDNELHQQVEKERAEKELAQRENMLLKRQKNEPLGFIYPDSIEQVRIESSALANQIVQCLDDMQQLIVVLNSATDLDSEDPNKSDAEYSAGASALAVNLTATYSKASFLLANFRSMVGAGFIPEQPEDTPLLTEEEAQRVFNMREYMLAEHEIEKSARNSARSQRRK